MREKSTEDFKVENAIADLIRAKLTEDLIRGKETDDLIRANVIADLSLLTVVFDSNLPNTNDLFMVTRSLL